MNTYCATALIGLLSLADAPARHEPPSDALAKGNAILKKGDFDTAIASFTEALRLNRGLAEAYQGRVYACDRKGDLDKATADFTEAIRLNPRFVKAVRGPRRRLPAQG